jgi:hypothetical protein
VEAGVDQEAPVVLAQQVAVLVISVVLLYLTQVEAVPALGAGAEVVALVVLQDL